MQCVHVHVEHRGRLCSNSTKNINCGCHCSEYLLCCTVCLVTLNCLLCRSIAFSCSSPLMSLLIPISVSASVNGSYLTRLEAEPSGLNTDAIVLISLLLATLAVKRSCFPELSVCDR